MAEIIAAPPPLTPGQYLQRRRVRIALSRSQAAGLLGLDRLTKAEDDKIFLPPGLLRGLEPCLHLDREVYGALVARHLDDDASELPVPDHCRICGCSWWTPCVTKSLSPCTWSDATHTLCTGCAYAAPQPAAARENAS